MIAKWFEQGAMNGSQHHQSNVNLWMSENFGKLDADTMFKVIAVTPVIALCLTTIIALIVLDLCVLMDVAFQGHVLVAEVMSRFASIAVSLCTMLTVFMAKATIFTLQLTAIITMTQVLYLSSGSVSQAAGETLATAWEFAGRTAVIVTSYATFAQREVVFFVQALLAQGDEYIHDLVNASERQHQLYSEIISVQTNIARSYFAQALDQVSSLWFAMQDVNYLMFAIQTRLDVVQDYVFIESGLTIQEASAILVVFSLLTYAVGAILALATNVVVKAFKQVSQTKTASLQVEETKTPIVTFTLTTTSPNKQEVDCETAQEQEQITPTKPDCLASLSMTPFLTPETCLDKDEEEMHSVRNNVVIARTPFSVIDLSESIVMTANGKEEEGDNKENPPTPALLLSSAKAVVNGMMKKKTPKKLAFESSGNDAAPIPRAADLFKGQQVTIVQVPVPGQPYKPGGVATISKIHEKEGTIDVRYTVEGGKGLNIPLECVVVGSHPNLYGMKSTVSVKEALMSLDIPESSGIGRRNRVVTNKSTIAVGLEDKSNQEVAINTSRLGTRRDHAKY